MQMETPASDTRAIDTRAIDAGLERLRRDLDMTDAPMDSDTRHDIDAAMDCTTTDTLGHETVNYAALEFELERMRKRLAIWQIFMNYMQAGAQTWPEVQRSLTQQDFEEIVRICDGVSLRDLLLDEG